MMSGRPWIWSKSASFEHSENYIRRKHILNHREIIYVA